MTTGNPRHVLVVVRQLVGGIRTYLKYVYPHLPVDRYRFTLVATATNETTDLADLMRPHEVDIRLLPASPSLPTFVRGLVGASRATAPVVVHAHGFTAGVACALAFGPKRPRLLLTSHDVFRRDQFLGWKGRARLFGLGAALARFDVVQSVSHDAQANLLEYLPRLTSFAEARVIPNGIDAAHFFREAAAPSAESTAPLLFVGRLMPQKGFTDLIDAVDVVRRRVPDIRVIVAGDGGFIREYRADIERRGLAACFDFTGFVADPRPLFSRVKGLVMPSHWEAGPLVPMEAMVAGCPLVASRCIGLREVVHGSPALTFEVGDVAALARHIEEIWTSPALHLRAAAAYADEARERFDARHTAAALDALLTTLAGGQA